MRTRIVCCGLLAAFFAAGSAEAVVAIGNGNYFIGFTDIEHPMQGNGFQLRVQRTYNSRSQYEGVFGFGWGTDNESFLLPSVDGSVVIQENGGGDKTRFNPQNFTKAQQEQNLKSLAAAYAKKAGGTPQQALEKLSSDADFRDEQSRRLGVFGQLPSGTKLFTTQRGDKQTVTALKEGFVREFADGKQEFFTVKTEVVDEALDREKKRVLKGVYKIEKIIDPVNKSQIFYTYDAKGQVTTVSDRRGQTLRYQYNGGGKVVLVTDATGKKASYTYCDSPTYNAAKRCGPSDLVESKDTSNSVYRYQYDNLHNLTKIAFANGTTEEIAYWPPNSPGAGGVRSVKNPNGSKVEYGYESDPKNKDEHYKTELKTTYQDGRTSTSSYEYWEKRRADGSRYRYKLVSMQDGERTETIYNECCGQPLQISSSAGTTKFEYYPASGLPKEKNTPSEITQWEYHDKFHGKVSKVTVMDKGSNSVKSSVYSYDDKSGQLLRGRTSDGKGVALLYDKAGRIQSMIDQDKRKITFRYNENSKPAEIIQEGVGSILVSYDKSGNIRDVQAKGSAGRKLALEIAGAFQNLLEIIKPAGIQPI